MEQQNFFLKIPAKISTLFPEKNLFFPKIGQNQPVDIFEKAGRAGMDMLQ